MRTPGGAEFPAPARGRASRSQHTPAPATTGRGPQAAAAAADPNVRAWTGRVAEIEAYLRTVVLGSHLARMPPSEHEAFVRAVAAGLPGRRIDYVRLNILARRA